ARPRRRCPPPVRFRCWPPRRTRGCCTTTSRWGRPACSGCPPPRCRRSRRPSRTTACRPAGSPRRRRRAGAGSTIEKAVANDALPTVGFYAQVPHYVGGPYAAAAIAILEHLGRHLGVEPPLERLPDEAMAQRERLDQIVQADDDSRTYVERLESVVDNQELPTGDELVGEIERFLQQRGDGGSSGPMSQRASARTPGAGAR